ncbi:collagenase [Colwellia psychrerythraea]|uniref:Microbial collagenase n=1 Tax=Colwellia psychrerythraea TaxID=28229 RepID=A0A099KKB7_COLPS|nr:collagenase [Colwellia psychrerythraea]KGJ90018.1 Microbial collagenase [Colwellia psychrerythraea]
MNKLTILLLTFAISSGITACSYNDKGDTANITKPKIASRINPLAAQVLATEVDQLWSQKFDHYQRGLLKAVADEISREALKGDLTNNALEKLSFYLRIYSSFGKDKDWTKQTAISVNTALVNLHSMPGFYEVNPTTARLHENYAVALYRLYFLTPLQPYIEEQVKPLSQLIRLYASAELPGKTTGHTEIDKAADYALWEVLRAGAILPYEARRENTATFINAVQGKGELQQALIDFITAKNNTVLGDDWPKQHALWALAQYYNLYEKQYWNEYYERSVEDQNRLDDDKFTLKAQDEMKALDNSVWAALKNNKAASVVQNKTLFSVPYVVNTFRGKSECEESTLLGRCILPPVEQALPINYECSSRIYILAQSMSVKQLSDSCQQLIAQENNFHEILATNNIPVANDFNDKLRVVIFDNHAEYNKFGQLTFDINTDNGGMYIEGTTQDPNNIATFYSFEHFWLRPEFAVWNLNHEFVHYLDGRFVKYDTFNHFPSHMVWWSEGLAEYIAKKNNNPKTFKLVNEMDPKDWPSLADIFNTEYKDGTDRVYRWGYLAVRFMNENHQDDYRKMAHYLKTDFFEGYKKLVEESGNKYRAEFTQWLVEHSANYVASDQESNPHKPRQFYRYTYKDYLQPTHLTEDKLHMHWQYWHENALKKVDHKVVNEINTIR